MDARMERRRRTSMIDVVAKAGELSVGRFNDIGCFNDLRLYDCLTQVRT